METTNVVPMLDECPVLPDALAAVVDGRTTPVSPTEFAFLSTPVPRPTTFASSCESSPGCLTQ